MTGRSAIHRWPLTRRLAHGPVISIGLCGDAQRDALVDQHLQGRPGGQPGHPGGQFTGLTIDTGPEPYGRSLPLFKEAMPGLSRLPVLWDRGATAQEDKRQVDFAPQQRLPTVASFSGPVTQGCLMAYSGGLL